MFFQLNLGDIQAIHKELNVMFTYNLLYDNSVNCLIKAHINKFIEFIEIFNPNATKPILVKELELLRDDIYPEWEAEGCRFKEHPFLEIWEGTSTTYSKLRGTVRNWVVGEGY